MKKSFQAGYNLLRQALSPTTELGYSVDQELIRVSQSALFLSLVALLFGQLLAQMLFSYLPADASTTLHFGIGLLPVQIIAFGTCLLGLAIAGKHLGWRALLNLRTVTWWQGAGREVAEVGCLLLMLLPLLLVINYLSTVLCVSLGIHLEPQLLEYFARQSPGISFWLLAFVGMVVWAPVSEEIIFRLVFYRAFAGIWPRQAAIYASLVFAFLHYRPQFMPGLFVFGLVCQAAFVRGGLRQAILVHALYNFCSLLLFLLVFILLES